MKLGRIMMVALAVVGSTATVSRAEPAPQSDAAPGSDDAPAPEPTVAPPAAPAADPARAVRAAAAAGHCEAARVALAQVARESDLYGELVEDPALLACAERAARARSQILARAAEASRRPPFSFWRALGGVSLGAVLALPGTFLSFATAAGAGYTGQEMSHVGLWAGYGLAVLGIAIGVHTGGSAGDHAGDFGTTLAGALAGGALSIVLTYAIPTRARDGMSSFGLGSAAVTPFVGALVGFHLTQRYEAKKPAARVGSVIMRADDRWSVGIPLVVHAEQATMVSIAAGSF